MARLLESLHIKSLQLSNRLVLPPMATAKSEGNGKVSNELLDYYNEKSKGGYIPLIIIEHSYVSPEGKASKNQLSIDNNCDRDGLRKLAKVIQTNGSKAIMQISHAGSATNREITGLEPVSASCIANPRLGGVPKELTKKEIEELVITFRDAAVRVKELGFDGVEIHSAHGYFLNQFYSPLTNKREDEYGGNIYNRIRIHLEIIKAVKEAVGDDFPILLRLGASDYTKGGTTIEDSKIAAKEIERAGVDILDVSGGFCGYKIDNDIDQGYFYALTEQLKEVISIPVILTGGITDIKVAEKLLKEKKADLIGVGRAILKDSNWAKNSIEILS